MVGMGVGNLSLVYTVLTLSLNQDCDFVFDNLIPHRGSSETQLHHWQTRPEELINWKNTSQAFSTTHFPTTKNQLSSTVEYPSAFKISSTDSHNEAFLASPLCVLCISLIYTFLLHSSYC